MKLGGTVMAEIWKALPGVPGIEVSTFGNVRTLDRVVSTKKWTRIYKGQVLKPSCSVYGYLYVNIKVNGKFISKRVHRLVAQTFLPNPDNLPMVNHKDCDRENNRVENLEWCDNSYNMQYREKYGVSNTESRGMPLFAINLATMELLHFRAQSEASRVLEADVSNINGVIKGKHSQTHGFWFVNDDENAVNSVRQKLDELGKTGLKAKDVASAKLVSQVMDCLSVN